MGGEIMLLVLDIIMNCFKKLFKNSDPKNSLDMVKSSVKCEDEFWKIR